MKKLFFIFIIGFYSPGLFSQATEVYYLRADIDEPWCCGWAPYPDSNPNEFDEVFGAGGWNLDYYEYADPGSIFSSNTCYVYMEGGDSHAQYMENFFSTNEPTIEQWVYNGGNLFLNAAPNVDDGMSYGFGGVDLLYPYWWTWDAQQTAAGAGHPIFSGPFTPVTTYYSGNYFAHAVVTGPGLTDLMEDAWTPGYIVLAEKSWGAGKVLFGGMTVSAWHWPYTEASNLKKNMHYYMYACNALLPVEFLDVDANKEDSKVKVEWSTASELNNAYFTVERSRNKLIWDEIAIVEGAGTSDQKNEYFIYDDHPLCGISYYRIKETDFDANDNYSKSVSVEIEPGVLIYPVPANDYINVVNINAGENKPYIINQFGEQLNCPIAESINSVRFELTGIPAGVYYVQIENGNEGDKMMFVKL